VNIDSDPALPASRQVWRWLRAAPWAALAELACRAGYVARGAVYLSIALIAGLMALRLSPHASGAIGALQAWSEWPFGLTLLWLAGAGLWGFAGWRILQSVFDADRQGRGLKALASRAGQLVSAAVYGGLALSVHGLLDTLDDLREMDERAQTQRTIEHVLSLPAGDLLVAAGGVFVCGAGLGNIAQALFARFSGRLTCPRHTRLPAALLGRVGYLARGLVFLPTGVFLVRAGLRARSAEAKGVGGAIDALSAQPFGHLAIGLLAIGLAAFGAYALFEARFRPIRLGDALADHAPRDPHADRLPGDRLGGPGLAAR
jgi:hypothetical protein